MGLSDIQCIRSGGNCIIPNSAYKVGFASYIPLSYYIIWVFVVKHDFLVYQLFLQICLFGTSNYLLSFFLSLANTQG